MTDLDSPSERAPIKIYFFSERRFDHAAVVVEDTIIVLGGEGNNPRWSGEILKSKLQFCEIVPFLVLTLCRRIVLSQAEQNSDSKTTDGELVRFPMTADLCKLEDAATMGRSTG